MTSVNHFRNLRDIFRVIMGAGVARGFSLLNMIIIARYLGASEFGKFSIFYLFLILSWRTSQGFDTTFIRYAKINESEELKSQFLKATVFLKVSYMVLFLGFLVPLSDTIAVLFFNKPEASALITKSVLTGCSLAFLSTISSTFQEQEHFGLFAILNAIFTGFIFFALMILILLKLKINLSNVISVYMIGGLAIGTISLIILFKKVGNIFSVELGALRNSFSMGKWVVGITLLHYILLKIDVMVLARYVDYGKIGIYAVAQHFVTIVVLLITAMSAVFLPKSMDSVKSQKDFRRYAKESILPVTIINILLLLLILFSPMIIKIAYGQAYEDATIILRILLIGLFFANFYTPFSFVFYALDDSRTRFILEFLGLNITFVLLLLFISTSGTVGAAVAKSFALIISAAISWLILQKRLKDHFSWSLVKNSKSEYEISGT